MKCQQSCVRSVSLPASLQAHHPMTIRLLCTLIAMLFLCQTGLAFARPPHPPGPPPGPAPGPVPGFVPPGPGPPPNPRIPPPGRIFPDLPLGFISLMVASSLFYYHAGTYYQRAPSGYVVVNAPIGAVVATLPPGFSSVVVYDVPYFKYGGVYYRQVPNGYQVVADPAAAPPPKVTSGKVQVTAGVLNVRISPNMGTQIINVVRRGDILEIHGSAPGWYYVQLPNRQFGWVKIEYTTPLPPPPNG